ncbi:MAG: hypothetical protein V4714_02900 [Bacteroidota bacterium]
MSKTSTYTNRKQMPVLTNVLLLLICFALPAWVWAQTGPGGVGNAAGTSGQPINKLWLRADKAYLDNGTTLATSNNQLVQFWADQSLNGSHASQATNTKKPVYRNNIINGMPALRFDGVANELLFGSSLDRSNALPLNFFAVTANTTNPRGLFDSRPGLGNVFRFFNDGSNSAGTISGVVGNNIVEFWSNNPSVSNVVLDQNGAIISVVGDLSVSAQRQLSVFLNSTQEGATATGNTTAVQFTSARLGSINSGSAAYFNGDIAEVIYYPSTLNTAQRIIIENYLGARYGISLTNSNDYYSSTTAYNDVIGIGTTDGTSKHSNSTGGALWLTEVGTTLNGTNEYVFAGHDGTVHSSTATNKLLNLSVISALITSHWAREYRIEKTGSADVKLGFDYTAAGLTRMSNTPSDYVLLYRSGTGNYSIVSTAGTDLSIPDQVSFTVTDANLANGYYTIGLKQQSAATTLYTYNANCAGGCDWATAANWTTDASGNLSLGAIVPRSIDNVVILTGTTANVTNQAKAVLTATINTGGTLDLGTTNQHNFGTLAGAGTLRMSALAAGTAVFPTTTTNTFLTTAGSTVEYYGATSYTLPATPNAYQHLIFSGGGTKTAAGVLTANGNFSVMASTSINTGFDLNLFGNFTQNGISFLASNGRTTFNSGGNQAINGSGSTTFFHLTIGNTANTAVTLSQNITVAGTANGTSLTGNDAALGIGNGANVSLTAGSNTVTFSGNGGTWVNGSAGGNTSFVPGTGTVVFAGNTILNNTTNFNHIQINSGASVASSLNSNLFIAGNLTNNGGTFNQTNGTTTFKGVAQNISGTGTPTTTFNSLIINSGSTTSLTSHNSKVGSDLTVSGTLNLNTFTANRTTAGGTLTVNDQGLLRIGGTGTFPTNYTNNTLNAVSTVEYYGADQSVRGLTYSNLTIAGTGTKTITGASATVNSNLVVSSSIFELAGQNLTVTGTTSISGTVTDKNDAGTNTFTGKMTVNTGGNVTISNASPFIFQGGLTNNGTFDKAGGGAITFNTNTPQLIDGSSPIKLLGAITVASNITVNNQNAALTINSLSVSQNAKWNNIYGLPTSYTGFSHALVPIGKFDNLAASNHVGASIGSTTGNNLKLSLAGSGTAYAVKTTSFAAASAMVIQFDLSATSAGATTNVASILMGTGLTNDATVNTATARLQVNLGSGSNDYTLTHPDGTPTNSSNSNSTQTVTWVINTSGSTVSYTKPDLTGLNSLATGKADVWLGNTLFAAGLAVQTPAQAMTQVKVVMTSGSGSLVLNNIRINPLGTITTGTVTSPYCITALTGVALSVPFTTDAAMTANTHFNTSNTFTAQLSNASGSFTNPISIGSLTTTALSGIIAATIPSFTASGTGYRIRVVSSAPISTATPNTSNLSINLFSASPYAAQSIVPAGVGSMLTATGVGVTGYQWGYYTILGGPITNLVGKTSATYTPNGPDFPGAGTYSLICQMTTATTCGTMTSNEVVLYINCPQPANSNIVLNGKFDDANFLGGTTNFTTEYNYVTGTNSMVPEGTFTIGNNPHDYHDNFCNLTTDAMRSPGSGGNMLIANAATSGSKTVWQQTMPVTINTDYVLTFYAASLAGSANSLQFGIYVGCFRAGSDISVPLAVVNCAWNKYSIQLNSGTSTSLNLQIRNISAAASGNDIAIDDIEFYPCQQVSSPPFPVANAYSWKGFSSNWFDKDNWGTACAIPTCADDVFIPIQPSGKVYPAINANGATAKTVTINTGASLTINPGYNLTLCGDMLNSGTLINSTTSTLTFISNKNPQLLVGTFTGTNKLGYLVVNKTSATDVVQLSNSIEIAGNLTITSGNLDANGQTMKIGGHMTNAGVFSPNNGTVEFNGTANQLFTQTGSGQFYNLVVNNSTATNTLTFNPSDTLITITNQLTLTRGIATPGINKKIFVSNDNANAVTGHSASSYVNGRLKRAVNGLQLYDFPVGDATRYELIRMQITSNLGPGLTNVTGLFNGSNPSAGTGLTGLDGGSSDYTLCNGGYWDLIPNIAAATGARYRLAIFPVSFSCAGLSQTFVKRPNASTAWTFNGSTLVDASTRDGFSSFSEIVPVSSNVALPVRLLSFEGKIKGRQIQLSWKTASEVDNAHFEVQRSSDAKSFEAIARVPGHGTTNDLMSYQSLDDKPQTGFNYYRLKQVDINGKSVYSHIIAVNNEQEVVELFPNPITKGSKLYLRISTLKNKQYVVLIYDLQGREISKETIKVAKGTTDVQISQNALLTSGNYIVRVLHTEQTELQNAWLFRLMLHE